MEKKIINVGVCGIGNLGVGMLGDFFDNYDLLQKKFGDDLEVRIKTICDLKKENLDLKFVPEEVSRETDFQKILDDPEIQIVVDLMSNLENSEYFLMEAIKRKKHVVTANKVLLAENFSKFYDLADEYGVGVGIEGALLGALPIVTSLRRGLIADRITKFYGILNGSTNFMLTEMEDRGISFQEAMKEAKRRGYFEYDSDLDLDAVDPAHKSVILAALCFGQHINLKDVYYEGIRRIRHEDFDFAKQLGYCLKLIAQGSLDEHDNLTVSVAPTMIPQNSILAKIKQNYNALFLRGDKSGETFYSSQVGGGMETGIGILADVLNLARDICYGVRGRDAFLTSRNIQSAHVVSYDEMEFPFYIRFVVEDQPGILAAIDEILAWHKINIKSFINVRDLAVLDSSKYISFVIDVDPAKVKEVNEAVSEMQGLKFFQEEPFVVRIIR